MFILKSLWLWKFMESSVITCNWRKYTWEGFETDASKILMMESGERQTR